MSEPDLLIIGGGVNGAGIARDAAGRGLRVVLVEQDDLAAHTSSASTKLIHGGLRYLEYREFRLVREALQERERLLRIAPHIAWPLRFVLPLGPGSRPAWLLRAGLFLYDHLGGPISLPRSTAVALDRPPFGAGLSPGLTRGFAYSDAWVDDSRLVVLNAMDAAARGAAILTRTRLIEARPGEDGWHAVLQAEDGGRREMHPRMLVNAAGPYAGIVGAAIGRAGRPGVRLVRGSHIVVPRLYEGEHAYILQNTDGRIVFTIPYESAFTLIGTTDVPVQSPAEATISDEEIAYLCDAVGRWFARPPLPANVVWHYSGIRPLYDDGAADAAAVTRDYVLELSGTPEAKLLSVFGGKITTYRRLAGHALEKLGIPGSWTATAPLPGGDIADFAAFLAALRQRNPSLSEAQAHRIARAYGTRAHVWLRPDLGRDFGAGLSEAEIDYLRGHEFARTAEDILWRRGKRALHMTPAQRDAVAEFVGG